MSLRNSEAVKLAIPSKGRLREPVLALLERAGVKVLYREEERLLASPTTRSEVQAVFMRPEDIPMLVEVGAADLGITGYDFIVEREADVEEILDLKVGAAEIVLAVPQISKVEKLENLPDGARIATRYINLTRRFLEERLPNRRFRILQISGAAEIMPMLGVADAIVDVSSTGVTLKAHGLKVLEVLLKTSARMIANKQLPEGKRRTIEELKLMLDGVVQAGGKKMVMMNVPDRCLKEVLEVIPSMSGPTIARVESKEPMWEVYAVMREEEVYDVILEAKKRGAKDLVILEVEKIIP